MSDIEDSIKEIHGVFSFFENPMDKIEQLIDYGKMAPGISEDLKIDKNKITGCTSMAWVVCNNHDNKIAILTDSESHIVRGLLHLLEKILNNRTRDEILNIEPTNILNNIGLGNNITSQRTNGFLSAVNKIQNQIKNI
tara:strand:- start:114 stop:527 length:414 start_codon:yes stop_codon:yes gene_type:complete